MVDAGLRPDIDLLDEAVVIGTQGDDTITPDDVARLGNTIGYEVLCNIGASVQRTWVLRDACIGAQQPSIFDGYEFNDSSGTRDSSAGYSRQPLRGKLRVIPLETCSEEGGCSGGCASCTGKTKAARKIIVECGNNDYPASGTQVTVRLFELNEALGAAIVFGIPLLLPLLTLAVWYSIDAATVESGAALLAALGAFVSGFLCVRLIDTLFRRRFPLQSSPTLQNPLPRSHLCTGVILNG
jgi:hypothetical protein